MPAKIKDLLQLKELVAEHRAKKEKIIFTNGCYDLLHIGHIRYLQAAKDLGDILIVAVNSDHSVKQLKGAERPIINEKERLEVLAALEMIDYLILFNEETASHLLEELQPDIYVKGGDYTLETLPELPVVRKYGGKVQLLKEIKGCSTSQIIKKIKGYNHDQS